MRRCFFMWRFLCHLIQCGFILGRIVHLSTFMMKLSKWQRSSRLREHTQRTVIVSVVVSFAWAKPVHTIVSAACTFQHLNNTKVRMVLRVLKYVSEVETKEKNRWTHRNSININTECVAVIVVDAFQWACLVRNHPCTWMWPILIINWKRYTPKHIYWKQRVRGNDLVKQKKNWRSFWLWSTTMWDAKFSFVVDKKNWHLIVVAD